MTTSGSRDRLESTDAHRIMKLSVRFVLIVLCLSTSTLGSSVLQVTFQQLATSSELIFEGQVIRSESRWNSDQSWIHTYVTFRVNDGIKGSAGTHVVLRFLGGEVDEIGLEVSGSTLPEVGERGIYFVERQNRSQVNPFYGLDQGHFFGHRVGGAASHHDQKPTNNHRFLARRSGSQLRLEYRDRPRPVVGGKRSLTVRRDSISVQTEGP